MAVNRIGIIGAGSVGSALAASVLHAGLAHQVVLCDQDHERAQAEALDLAHGLQFLPPGDIVAARLEALEPCEIVVITAGARQRRGQSRLELAAANAAVVAEVLPIVLATSPDAVVLLVTNPVDVVTYVAHQVAPEHRGRILGSGTVLDTSRLRLLLSQRLEIAVTSVHATIVGEHGDSSVPLWSSATVGGAAIDEVMTRTGEPLSRADLESLAADVRRAAAAIIAGKGSTSWAIAWAATRILSAIVRDERAVLAVSWAHDVSDIGRVCFSMPTVVGRWGVLAPVPVTLDDDEYQAVTRSARVVKDAIDALGDPRW